LVNDLYARIVDRSAMKHPDDVVFLFDCDNTLLDNDGVQEDLRAHLESEFGLAESLRYWSLYEALRDEVGYADYLGAMQRFRLGMESDPRVLRLASFLLDYPFASRLYSGALEAVAHCRRWGPTVVLSDGDIVLQPRKLQRSGLWDAFEGRVLIYIHKERMLDEMAARFPARRYVMADDKLRVLTAMKEILGDKLSTVFPRQGHYALDAAAIANYPPADIAIERIGDLLREDFS
jgi:FMN phosphatase YigB (HAD superfamily)